MRTCERKYIKNILTIKQREIKIEGYMCVCVANEIIKDADLLQEVEETESIFNKLFKYEISK